MRKKISLILILFVFLFLFFNSGFLQANQLDDRDLNRWNYKNNEIVGSEEVLLEGSNSHCWILIHGYVSTPAEMKELAYMINSRFGDSVFAVRLSGHGQTPSRLKGKSLDSWYVEIQDRFNSFQCDKINVVGSSFGGTLALRLAEDKKLNNVYLVNPFLFTGQKPFFMFADLLEFLKKDVVGSISDPEGLKKHIAYLNMPLVPVKDSFGFIDQTIDNLGTISESTLIFHSVNDDVSQPRSSKVIYEGIGSIDKEIVWFDRSNHILLMDYDKEIVMDKILEFESLRR